MPKVSVIMPVYNAEKYIGEAIESILDQTYTDFEFIIIDDGSSDGTVAAVKGYDDRRIRFYQNEHNMGVAATLNRGLDLATGEYIARMDSDDISLPERFEKQVRFMDEHSEVAVLGAGIELFFAQHGERIFSQKPEELKVDLLFGNCFAHPAVMMRAAYFGGSGFRYDNRFNKMEDFDLWDRVSQHYAIASLPEVLLKYRIHPNQVTQKLSEENIKQTKALKERQLQRFGIASEKQSASLYIDYCTGKFEKTENNIKKLSDFFRLMEEKNRTMGLYDEIMLENYLSTIIKGLINQLSISSAIKLTKACGFNPVSYSAERSIRSAVARMEGAIRKKKLQSKLKSKDFSIISNNCWGSFIYQRYGLEYTSPTAGLYILGRDFVKFAGNLEYYLSLKLEFIPWESSTHYEEIKDETPYPVAKLGDIEVYFMHYHSEQEAAEKWYRRAKRVNTEHILFKLSEREGCSKKDIEDFIKLPLEHKLCFAYDDVPGTIHIPELEGFSGDEMSVVDPYIDEISILNQL